MKKSLYLLFTLLVISICTSCGDECKDVKCQNGGTCDNGECDCPSNTKGENCEFQCVECSDCQQIIFLNMRICEDQIPDTLSNIPISMLGSAIELVDSTCNCN